MQAALLPSPCIKSQPRILLVLQDLYSLADAHHLPGSLYLSRKAEIRLKNLLSMFLEQQLRLGIGVPPRKPSCFGEGTG